VGFFYAGAAYQFQTVNPITIASGTNTLTNVLVEAVVSGTAYNVQSLSSLNEIGYFLQMQTQDPNVSSVVISATPATNSALVAGTDPETTDAFLNRLTAELQLLAPRPITPSDYALFAQNVAGIYRAQSFDGFNSLTNLLSASNASFLLATSTPSGWGVVGNGTATVPSISTPGTSPANYLQFTSTSTALVSTATVSAVPTYVVTAASGNGTTITYTAANSLAVGQTVSVTGLNTTTGASLNIAGMIVATASSTQFTVTNSTVGTSVATQAGVATPIANAAGSLYLSVTVGTGATFSTTISSVAPSLVAIGDTTNGNEVVIAAAASATFGSGSTTQQTLTLTNAFNYTHASGGTIKQLQGASLPVATGLFANSYWYQAAAVIKAAGSAPATTATERPYVVVLATYIDGSLDVFYSLPKFDDSLYTYTSNTKTVLCNIPSTNANSASVLAYDPGVTTGAPLYGSGNVNAPRPYITSAQMYIAFSTVELSKTHAITYASLNEVQQDLTALQSMTTTTSAYNFIPDATFQDYAYAYGGNASWSNPTGTTILPGTGVQYQGTGAALGSSLTVSSQAFNLSHLVSDVPAATTRTYTLFATVNANYVASNTYNDISIQVVNVATSTVLATVSPAAAATVTLPITFTLSSPADVQVNIVFGAGLNVPLGSSVIVSNVAVVSGSYSLTNLPALNQSNYFWTPGGLYNPNTFNYPRTVSIVPLDANGLPVAPTIAQNLSSYLAARRETNFTVNTINPNYVPIDVQYTIYISPAYTVALVQSAVNAAIRSFLSPATWAGGSNIPPYWNGAATSVNVMDIGTIIGSVAGVSNVVAVSARTSYPLGGAYLTTSVPLTGVAPLPIANTITPTVYSNPANNFTGL